MFLKKSKEEIQWEIRSLQRLCLELERHLSRPMGPTLRKELNKDLRNTRAMILELQAQETKLISSKQPVYSYG